MYSVHFSGLRSLSEQRGWVGRDGWEKQGFSSDSQSWLGASLSAAQSRNINIQAEATTYLHPLVLFHEGKQQLCGHCMFPPRDPGSEESASMTLVQAARPGWPELRATRRPCAAVSVA